MLNEFIFLLVVAMVTSICIGIVIFGLAVTLLVYIAIQCKRHFGKCKIAL